MIFSQKSLMATGYTQALMSVVQIWGRGRWDERMWDLLAGALLCSLAASVVEEVLPSLLLSAWTASRTPSWKLRGNGVWRLAYSCTRHNHHSIASNTLGEFTSGIQAEPSVTIVHRIRPTRQGVMVLSPDCAPHKMTWHQ